MQLTIIIDFDDPKELARKLNAIKNGSVGLAKGGMFMSPQAFELFDTSTQKPAGTVQRTSELSSLASATASAAAGAAATLPPPVAPAVPAPAVPAPAAAVPAPAAPAPAPPVAGA